MSSYAGNPSAEAVKETQEWLKAHPEKVIESVKRTLYDTAIFTLKERHSDWEKISEQEKINFITQEIGNIYDKTKPLKLNNYYDNVKIFSKQFPFFYDKSELFWFWDMNKYCYLLVDETDLMNNIDRELGFLGQTVGSGVKSNYLESFRRVGRLHTPKNAPAGLIQFKNRVFDIKTSDIYSAEPNFFFTNPIPWELGETDETPTMDKLFSEWVGSDNINTLYEAISYCCYRDYPIHLIFCLIGHGRNGKSSFLKIISKFLGKDNIASTELDILLDNRFESTKLFKKLAVMMGETNFGVMKKTSLLKKLCGQDLIGFEFKNKQPFDDYNYAKIFISSNSLPSSEDTSEGFYRRWLIVNFQNEFPEGKDIVDSIPEYEYHNLAKKVSLMLPKLLERGNFVGQGTITERKEKYILSSNPLPLFLKEYCDFDPNEFVQYTEIYTSYVKFLTILKRRVVSHREFCDALVREGYEKKRTSKKIGDEYINSTFVLGLKMKNVHDVLHVQTFPLSKTILMEEVEKPAQRAHGAQSQNHIQSYFSDKETMFLSLPVFYSNRCHKCDLNTGNEGDVRLFNGSGVCKMCFEQEVGSDETTNMSSL